MKHKSTSVLIPTYRRGGTVKGCLKSLSSQTVLPDEVIIVWQGSDNETNEILQDIKKTFDFDLKVLHLAKPGIVPAENIALQTSIGEIIFLIDDDAVAPHNWIETYLLFYQDDNIGAVGGPVCNHYDYNYPPKSKCKKTAHLSILGHSINCIFTMPEEMYCLPTEEVDQLAGPNMSFRRDAVDKFNIYLKPYWYEFELEACFQVKNKKLKVMFDYSCVVDHYPQRRKTLTTKNKRPDDKLIQIYNPAYNHSLVISQHGTSIQRYLGLIYDLLIGTRTFPGLVGSMAGMLKYKNISDELVILFNVIKSRILGWMKGSELRKSQID